MVLWSNGAERINGRSHSEVIGHSCIAEALYAPSAIYGNWELSSDCANAARRVMQANGIKADQITQVRGFAGQRLRKPDAPLDPANRRISVIVQYIVKNNDDEDGSCLRNRFRSRMQTSQKLRKPPRKK